MEFSQVLLVSYKSIPKTANNTNDTLVDTSFQLISDFFHVNQGSLCFEHAEQASSRGVLEGGGGGAKGLLNKGEVLTSNIIMQVVTALGVLIAEPISGPSWDTYFLHRSLGHYYTQL